MATSLHVSAFSLTPVANNRWTARPAFGTEFDALFAKEYWAHIAAKLRVGDIIDVYPEGAQYYAELYVDRVGKMEASVLPLRKIDLGPLRARPEPVVSTFSVKWRGPKGKYGVVRDADGAVIQSGFITEEEAKAVLAGLTAVAA
jgi:hypothetical protein